HSSCEATGRMRLCTGEQAIDPIVLCSMFCVLRSCSRWAFGSRFLVRGSRFGSRSRARLNQNRERGTRNRTGTRTQKPEPGTQNDGVAVKVLHVTAYYAPAYVYGGPPRSVHGLVLALQRQGVDVDVFTTDANGSD